MEDIRWYELVWFWVNSLFISVNIPSIPAASLHPGACEVIIW